MAEKTILEFDIQTNEQKIDSLTGSIISLNEAIKVSSKEIKTLEKTNQDLDKQVKQGKITQEEANIQQKENSKRIIALKKDNAGLKDGITDLNKTRRQEVAIAKTQVGSLNALRQQTAKLTKERNSLDRTTKTGAERFQKLTVQIKANNDEIKKADQSAGDFKTSIGGYEDAVKNAIGSTNLMSGTFGRMVAITKNAQVALIATSKSLGIFKVALISTGIGALIVALGAVISFLTKTQSGIDKVSQTMSFMGAIVDEIVDRFSSLGKAMIEAIENPQKLWEDFLGFLERQVTTRIEGLIQVFTGLGSIIEGVFTLSFDKIEDGLGETGDAFVKFTTGFSTKEIVKGFENVVEVIKDVGETALNEANQALELEKSFQALQDKQIQFISERARIEKEIAELRLRAEDLSLSDEERIDALRRGIELTRNLANQESVLANEELRIAEERVALGESTRDDIREVEELRARVFDLQKGRLLQEKRLVTELNTEEVKLETNRKKRDEERQKYLEEQKELDEENFEKFLEGNEKFLEEIENTEEKRIEIEQKSFEKSAELREKNTEDAINSVQKLGNKLLSLNALGLDSQQKQISKSFDNRQTNLEKSLETGLITQGEFNKKAKELDKEREIASFEIELAKFKSDQTGAVANIAIDTAQNVVEAFPNPIQIASALGLGAIETALVLGEDPPQRPIFAKGGEIKSGTFGGNLHSGGGTKGVFSDGTKVEVEKGERFFVMNRSASQAISRLSDLNVSSGGRPFEQASKYLQDGGSVSLTGNNEINSRFIKETVEKVLKNVNIVVTVEDIATGLTNFNIVNNQATVGE